MERLRPPGTGRIELGDEVCPGPLLRITERGVRSFSVIYKIVGEGGVSASGRLLIGKQHWITLGQRQIYLQKLLLAILSGTTKTRVRNRFAFISGL